MTKHDWEFDWRNIQDKIEKVLGEEFLTEMNQLMPSKTPHIDMYETDDVVYVVAELPGLESDLKAIDIHVEGFILIIAGKIPYEYPVPKDDLLISERKFGRFQRKIKLPHSISSEGTHAYYKKGILEVVIPKREDLGKEKVNVEFVD